MTIGDRIKAFRQDRSLSLTELAREAGISKGYLSALERSQAQNPSVESLGRLARALGLQLSDLLGDAAPSEPRDHALPKGLKEFLDSAHELGGEVTPDDVAMLLGIRYRGRQPRTAEDWAYLYETIKRTIR